MKIILLITAILLSSTLFSQDNKFSGIWEGKINVGVSLRIAFHFNEDSAGNIVTTMDSPDQSAFGMPTDYTTLSNDSIYTVIKQYNISFSGKLTSDTTISGAFKQVASVPLLLKKVLKVTTVIRPQTPAEPFPYNTEEVSYASVKEVRVAGTLTSPKLDSNTRNNKATSYPAILLISGSGPQNRDEEVMGHKPFAVIADFLTKKGFIVLRVDDRGTGKTTGNFNESTTEDFADDVIAGIDFLKKRKDVDTLKIGLLGHSEGGMIAPMVAAKRKDIDFLVLLAGPGIKPIDLMTEQNLAIFNSMGMSNKTQQAYGVLYKKITMTIVNGKDSISKVNEATHVLNSWLKERDSSILNDLGLETPQKQKTYVNNMVTSLDRKWFKYFLNYDPAPILKKVNAKVLVLNGNKDIQVISKSNLAGMEAALKKTSSVFEVHEIPGVNHLFQNCITCTVNEYGQLDETISPIVLEKIGEWLVKTVL